MRADKIIETNKSYWNTNADLWFGATALPVYGVKFATEEELHLFGDVSGKKMLEIFVIEQMVEQNDRETMETTEDTSDKTRKAKMIPISVCFKARKL